MKNLLIALLFSLCLFSCVFGEGEESVLNLTQETFDNTISSNEFVLNMFYAPWCGHCKTLKPIFEETAQKTKGKYVLAKVDCTVEKDLCSKFEVRGYPTVVFFKNGNKKEYDGPRSVDGIINWLDKKSGPITIDLATAEAIKEFSKENHVLGFFSNKDEVHKAFVAAAEDAKTSDMKFGIVSDSSLFGENKEGSIVLITKDGRINIPSEQTGSAATLATFLFDSTFPLIQEVDASNFKNYVSRGKRLMLAWIKLKEETAKQQIEVISKLAGSYPQFSFGYISHENFGPNMERMGASGKVVPAITLLSFTDNKPISFEKEGQWDEENVKDFIEGVISGKYKYQLKSEAIPEDTNAPVTVIVGKNFDQIVHDKTKDVLVEFYAPWCGHCKSLAPEFEKLGEAFKNVNDVVIGKIDLTANDVETSHYEVKGFPTILLYKRDAKEQPLLYQGGRDAKSIAAWIKDNTHSQEAKTINHDEL